MPRSDAIRKLKKVKDKIGQVTDAEIAEEAGVSLGSVRAYRKRHGIAPAKTRRATRAKAAAATAAVATRKARGKDRKPRRSKVGAVRHLLGNLPDADVAKQAGVTIEAVRMYRRRHSIESHVPASAVGNAPRRRRSALDPYFDMLGTVPDSEIGALAGVTGENVRAYRRRHGIDAMWKGAKSRKPVSKAARPSTPSLLPVPAPSAPEGAQVGFLVTLKGGGDHVVLASNIASAVSVAVAAGSSEVIAIRTLGPVLG